MIKGAAEKTKQQLNFSKRFGRHTARRKERKGSITCTRGLKKGNREYSPWGGISWTSINLNCKGKKDGSHDLRKEKKKEKGYGKGPARRVWWSGKKKTFPTSSAI